MKIKTPKIDTTDDMKNYMKSYVNEIKNGEEKNTIKTSVNMVPKLSIFYGRRINEK